MCRVYMQDAFARQRVQEYSVDCVAVAFGGVETCDRVSNDNRLRHSGVKKRTRPAQDAPPPLHHGVTGEVVPKMNPKLFR